MGQYITGREVSLSIVVRSLWRRRYMTGSICLASMVIAAALGFTRPKTFESTASILPGQQEMNAEGILQNADLGAAAPLAATLLRSRSVGSAELFTVMLTSRVMADAAIARFDLMRYFQTAVIDDARRALAGATTVQGDKDEALLSVSVVTTDPQLSADIANFYVAQLDHLNRTMTVTKASQTRAFLESRLAEVKVALVSAEEALRDFQSQNKAIAVEAQASAMVEGVATLHAQLTAQEVQLQVARKYLAEGNPEVVRLRSTVDSIRRHLGALESEPRTSGHAPGPPSMEAVPSLALRYVRLLREVKMQEQIHILLLAQLEQAKLQEARDTPTVQLLDSAVPALRKKGPKVRLFVLVGLLVGLLASTVIALRRDLRGTRDALGEA